MDSGSSALDIGYSSSFDTHIPWRAIGVIKRGAVTGVNLPHYPAGVRKIVGVDPSAASAALARKRIQASPLPVEVIGLSAEKIPVADESVESLRPAGFLYRGIAKRAAS